MTKSDFYKAQARANGIAYVPPMTRAEAVKLWWRSRPDAAKAAVQIPMIIIGFIGLVAITHIILDAIWPAQ